MATEEKKKNPIQKRLNPNGLPGSDDDPKKRPRISIYWVYGLIFAAIIGYNLYRGTSSSGVEMDNTQFYAMLKQGEVDQIKTVGNKKIVRVYINQKALQSNSDFFRNVFGDSYEEVKKMPAPQAYFPIVKDESFSSDLRQFYNDNPDCKTCTR